jgi:hypothetical protein
MSVALAGQSLPMPLLATVALGAVLLLLGGCYSIPRWAPGPEAREQNFKRDDYGCIRETSQRGAGGTGLGAAAAIRSSNNESRRLRVASRADGGPCKREHRCLPDARS